MKRTVNLFTSAMIAAGVMVGSALAQSLTATNRGGKHPPSPPGGQMTSLTPLTNQPSLTHKRPLPPRLNSVTPVVVKPLPSVNPASPQPTLRLQQPIPQPRPIASVGTEPSGTPPAQPK